MALFRVDYTGRGELGDRQQKLNQMLSRLTRISEEYNVAIFITNQVQSGKVENNDLVVIFNSLLILTILFQIR